MKGLHLALQAAGKLYTPLIALFALSLLAGGVAGTGIGLSAGLAFALVLALHLIVHGARAARAATPPALMGVLVSLGVALALLGAGAPGLPYALQVLEAGLFIATAAGFGLMLTVLAGRAPTLRDEDW